MSLHNWPRSAFGSKSESQPSVEIDDEIFSTVILQPKLLLIQDRLVSITSESIAQSTG